MVYYGILSYINTLPKFNIAPEKVWLEDYFPFGMVLCIFRGYVKLWEGIP